MNKSSLVQIPSWTIKFQGWRYGWIRDIIVHASPGIWIVWTHSPVKLVLDAIQVINAKIREIIIPSQRIDKKHKNTNEFEDDNGIENIKRNK